MPFSVNLMIANQYMAQIPSEVQKAILGNVGTLVSFSVGAADAGHLRQEFAGVFSENDLINLANRQIALKLMIDGHAQRPFLATTLALASATNHNRAKIIRVSRERWGRKRPQKKYKRRIPRARVPSAPSKGRNKVDAA